MAEPARSLAMADPVRLCVARALRTIGRSTDAAMVEQGHGDDFPEVRVARQTLRALIARQAQLERALRCYADASFWDDEPAGSSLAAHDAGAIARAALDGRELYGLHRD